jgi:hydroxymethylbilane synthase
MRETALHKSDGSARTFLVGTRGSALAMAQTEMAVAALRARHPDVAVEIRVLHTGGDRDQRTPLAQLGGQGVFVKEIENALQAGEVDLAVHSLKDMPSEQPEGLVIAAVLEREDPRDALISRLGAGLEDLPKGARVGTGSLRRQAQLRALRPDLQVVDLRGNVDTRLRKAASGEYDAVVLALAGLVRLGRAAEVTAILPFDVMLPAVGQGAVCIEARADDEQALALARAVDHPASHTACLAERNFLRELGGGCRVPIAAYATLQGGRLWLRGLVASADGARMVRGSVTGRPEEASRLGQGLARQLLAGGCAELLREGAAHA